MQRWRHILYILLLGLIAILGYLVFLNYRFCYRPLASYHHASMVRSIRIPVNTHFSQLAHLLSANGLWRQRISLRVLVKLHGMNGELHYGEYEIQPGMTLQSLLNNIYTGRGFVDHAFRIHEGGTLNTLYQRIAQSDQFTHSARLSDYKPPLDPWLSAPSSSLEGLLYPDTYSFAWGASDRFVIRTGYRTMMQRLQSVWPTRQKTLPIKTPYQALIVASLIQTEAAKVSERPKVAAVIYNRLRRGMRLQIDPTVTYGLGLPYGTHLKRSQLKKSTPYNTYVIKGLPPTPIAFATQSAIDAALHPAAIQALFYVADGQGGHVFTRHYKAHQEAVEVYRATVNRAQWEAEREVVTTVYDTIAVDK